MIETPYRNAALLDALVADAACDDAPRRPVAASRWQAGWTRSDAVATLARTPGQMPTDVPAVFALQAER